MAESLQAIEALDAFSPLRWEDDQLYLLDQTRLPAEEVWLSCTEPETVAEAIRRLSVRGAPAIGVRASASSKRVCRSSSRSRSSTGAGESLSRTLSSRGIWVF